MQLVVSLRFYELNGKALGKLHYCHFTFSDIVFKLNWTMLLVFGKLHYCHFTFSDIVFKLNWTMLLVFGFSNTCVPCLTHWGRDKMAVIFQTTFSKLFSWIKMYLFRLNLSEINNIPALVQIMAWCRPGDKPLSKPMLFSLLKDMCVTWPQWVTQVIHACT